MKKRVILISSALTVVCALCLMIFVGCVGGKIKYDTYAQAESYLAGNRPETTENINAVEIDWVYGKVTIIEREDGIVSVTENSETLPEEQRVHSVIQNGILKVRFWKSGLYAEADHNLKHVTVQIPKGIRIDVETVSAPVEAENLNCLSLDAETVSGKIAVINVAATGDIELKSVSGAINTGNLTGNSVEIDSVSGNAETGEISCISFNAETTSGAINTLAVTANVGEISTTSGSVDIGVKSLPALEIETTSGNVKVTLIGDAGATLNVNTVSGKITKPVDGNVIGNGANRIEVNTISGSIEITTKSEAA